MSATAPARGAGYVKWLEHSIAGIAGSVERAVFTESLSRECGWLQGVDARAKIVMFLALVIAASFARSFLVLAALYLVVLAAARASRLPFDFFVRRTWLGIPFFAGIVVLPSVFFTPGPRLFDVPLGPLVIGPSVPGLLGAAVFILRVGVSVSLAVLLVLTTPWAQLLRSLQALHVPHVFTLILAMTYRYIFLFLHALNGLFEARKSRIVARAQGADERRWITQSMGTLLSRSFKMSDDVYTAMLARGFTGEIRTYGASRMRAADVASLVGALLVASAALVVERLLS